MAKETKTNVMRILDRAKIPYRHYSYEHEEGAVDGVSVARLLGQNPAQVYKTLVTRGAGGGFFVFVIPVQEELDLKAAARAVGEKSVSMLHVNELLPTTGYVRGGCSPIGMKKQFPTVVDESCLSFDTIIFSGGRIGAQVRWLRPTCSALWAAARRPWRSGAKRDAALFRRQRAL